MSYFKAKMHQIRFRLGYAPGPAGGAYSAPKTLAGFKGGYFKGKGGEGTGWEDKGGQGKGAGRERREREGKGRRGGKV